MSTAFNLIYLFNIFISFIKFSLEKELEEKEVPFVIDEVTKEGIEVVVRKMRKGPHNIPIEVWRCVRKEGVKWLKKLLIN